MLFRVDKKPLQFVEKYAILKADFIIVVFFLPIIFIPQAFGIPVAEVSVVPVGHDRSAARSRLEYYRLFVFTLIFFFFVENVCHSQLEPHVFIVETATVPNGTKIVEISSVVPQNGFVRSSVIKNVFLGAISHFISVRRGINACTAGGI